jgi:hypothetical protein
MLLAEGFGQDAKGAVTAIGVNQSVVIAKSLPTTTKRAVLVHLSDEEGSLKPGGKMHFSFSVQSPSGRVLLAQSGQLAAGERPWPDLPATVDIPAEFTVTTYEYGAHRITAQIQCDGGENIECSVPLYVHEPVDSIQLSVAADPHEPSDEVTGRPVSEPVET